MKYLSFKKGVFLMSLLIMGYNAQSQEDIIISGGDTIVLGDENSITTEGEGDEYIITDDQTVDSDKNAAWRSGTGNYSAEPNHMWELGLHVGAFHVNGDIPSNVLKGCGYGLHIRRAFNYFLSWRVDGMISFNSGLDGRLSDIAVLKRDNTNLDFAAMGYSDTDQLYRSFKAQNVSGSVHMIMNWGNLLFHSARNKWNFYTGLGLGATGVSVKMDYLNGSAPYDITGIQAEYGYENTSEKRAAIRELFDGEYESDFENDRNVPGWIHDSGEWFPQFVGTAGVSRKINRRFNVSLEHQVHAQDYDKWDGHEYRTTLDQTNDSDIAHYTNLRIGMNLGSFKNRTEPLYWINPLDRTFNDIAELKRRPQLDLTDSDQDGVIDMLDKEDETPVGAAVDTRGVTLDSDGDGIADYNDKEPYSPPGFIIDDEGLAQVKSVEGMTEADVVSILNKNCPNCGDRRTTSAPSRATTTTIVKTGCGEWFLPMIHFDLDKYAVKPEFYGQLHHVATVLKQCPELCVVAQGHTDARNSNDYNKVLSYNRAKQAIDYLVSNYGIDRSRFKLMYGGEENPLVGGLGDNHNISSTDERAQYMNRRVEFRVCNGNDFDMPKPAGSAGRQTEGSSRVGSKYSGNKNSGY